MGIIEEQYTFHSATEDDLAELIEFCQDNINPEWQFCAGAPPYPTPEKMQEHVALDNPFIIGRKNGEIAGYHIASKEDGRPYWGLARKDIQGEELQEAHAHILAHVWNARGGPSDAAVPDVSDENVADELNSAMVRALEVYEGLQG